MRELRIVKESPWWKHGATWPGDPPGDCNVASMPGAHEGFRPTANAGSRPSSRNQAVPEGIRQTANAGSRQSSHNQAMLEGIHPSANVGSRQSPRNQAMMVGCATSCSPLKTTTMFA